MSSSGTGTIVAASGDGDLTPNMKTTVESHDWVLIVDAVILTATILGATFTLSSMAWLEWRGRPSTTRMRIVQSLVLSDFVLGVVGLIGVALALSPTGLHQGSTCDGLGVMLLAVLYSEHLWTLALAIATFLILIHPLHKFTIVLEHRWWLLWFFVWAISFGLAVAGQKVTGLVPAGGICYYGSDEPLFGELMQFIPRGFVFVVITVLYVRLFIFLRRPDKIRSPYSNVTSEHSDHSIQGALRKASRQSTGLISGWFRRTSTPAHFHKENVVAQVVEPKVAIDPPPGSQATKPAEGPVLASKPTRPPTTVPSPRRPSAEPGPSPALSSSPTEEIPPWERVELPAFQIDGQRFGGSSTNVPSNSTSLWGNWKGLGGSSSVRETRKRPSTSGSGSSPTPPGARKLGSFSSWETASNGPTRRPSILSPRLEPITSHFGGEEGDEVPHRPRTARTSASSTGHSDPMRKLSAISDTAHGPTPLGQPLPGSERRASAWTADSQSSGLLSPKYKPTIELREGQTASGSGTQTPDDPGTVRRDRAKGSTLGISSDAETAAFEEADMGTAQDLEKQEGDKELTNAEEDAEWDLMRMLQQGGPPPKHPNDRFAPAEGETVELVEESMASYLNRKTALLMLWFPLGYVLLFSVSLVRLIFDFAGKPPTALRAISRWFVFAQGILDALIYGLVEWHTKRVVRRRVRKGTFSPSHSHSHGSNSWPKIFSSRRSQPLNTQDGQGSRHSQSAERRASKQTQSVTFSRLGERSIVQDIESYAEPRRGSAVDSLDTKLTDNSGSSGGNASTGTGTKLAGTIPPLASEYKETKE